MAERILTWHYPEPNAPLPAFYADEDYEKSAVRIHADTAPDVGDCEVDIFCDGVSIFNNHATAVANVANADTYKFTWSAVETGVVPIVVGSQQLFVFSQANAATGFIQFCYCELPSSVV